jgi:hypothetical protein
MRGRAAVRAELHGADAAQLARIAEQLRPLQQGALWNNLLASAAAIVVLMARKNPQASQLVAEQPGEDAALCIAVSESAATLHVHGCLYLIESEAPWTVLALRGIWLPPLRPIVTLLCEAEAKRGMRLH